MTTDDDDRRPTTDADDPTQRGWQQRWVLGWRGGSYSGQICVLVACVVEPDVVVANVYSRVKS